MLDGEIQVVRQTAAFAVIDANNLCGMVSAHDAMALALKNVEQSGMYAVFSRGGNTFGAAFSYVLKAAAAGKIGIVFCNTPAAMAPWGGKGKRLGTNPIACGIPGRRRGPILLDMATSVVAKSKINEIAKTNGTLPHGWALDENGVDTTDPHRARLRNGTAHGGAQRARTGNGDRLFVRRAVRCGVSGYGGKVLYGCSGELHERGAEFFCAGSGTNIV